MKIVVIGGTGLVGSKLVQNLRRQDEHEVVPAAPNTGVNTLTGEGLSQALDAASVVVDVSGSPSFEAKAALEFFETSTRNVLDTEEAAGVRHHVALSIVGADRLTESGYVTAKLAQEKLVTNSSIPYTIVHATQFFEFAAALADMETDGDTVRVPPALIQPIAADDVADALCHAALAAPLNKTIEVGGPVAMQIEEFVRKWLAAMGDARGVVSDPRARYDGARLSERTLLPGDAAQLGPTRFDEWLDQKSHRDRP